MVATLALGLSQAEAAYRLTFQNGTSIEVRSYEDLGDAIRYLRYGGTVVVPKAQATAIQEVVAPDNLKLSLYLIFSTICIKLPAPDNRFA